MRSASFVYRGSSMRGTLRFGDSVKTDNTPFSRLQRGDIVVYRNPDSPKHQTIHRVIRRRHQFIATQGDNVAKPDKYHVTHDFFICKATAIERNGITMRIYGGYIGFMWSWILHLHRRIRSLISPLSRPLYELTGRAVIGLLRWTPEIVQMKIALPPEDLIKYIHNGKTVAQWNQETGLWDCRKPYDLILKKPE